MQGVVITVSVAAPWQRDVRENWEMDTYHECVYVYIYVCVCW